MAAPLLASSLLRRRLGPAGLAAFLLIGLATAASAQPAITHPRLIVRAEDLPRLQAWAVPGNPVYQNGLLALATQAKADMDGGLVPAQDTGGASYETYPSEMYAELFAFMSLITTDPTAKADYIERAHTLLMYVMNQAFLGVQDGQPFRGTAFATSDRSRWYGEGFALTVDWVYDALTPADKATILAVFLRWAEENRTATTTSFNHPEPLGVYDDPQLTANLQAVRFSTNNYYVAHMRNMGLMAMALDDGDDPGLVLRNYLHSATGAFLYVLDHLLRTDSRGGLAPEGFEYSPQSIGYALQFLLALHTAGRDDPAAWGGPLEPQVVLTNNPFWNDVLSAYLSAVSPAPTVHPYLGQVYQPAWYGAAQNYWAPDFIGAFGALGAYDYLTGNAARLAGLRWFETNIPPGGAADLTARARDENFFFHPILYFLLFDPTAPPPPDPRPSLPLTFFVPGIGRLLARTDWGPNATWFTYALAWNSIDHQNADGNQFEFYRRGEWLTKQRTGYDLDYGASDNHNTLSLENGPPDHNNPGDYRRMLYLRGSQWLYVASGDPQVVARSSGPGFVYALGDATNLYNSTYENSTDILHASRSIVWLKPDHIVVYDRAESQTAGRFKRFWLNLPALADVTGNPATMTTATGQQLFVTTLQPAGAAISSFLTPDEPSGTPASQETMRYRLLVEAPGGPASVRFLHVLQGADAGAVAAPVLLVQSTAGTPFVGAAVRNTVTLFPVDLAVAFAGVTYSVPDSVTVHRITGLTPGGLYDVTVGDAVGGQVQVTVSPGTTVQADGGGVLVQGDPGAFFTLTPCRVADTRDSAGPSGGPALAANTTRNFPAAGLCGISMDAVAVAINVTVVQETDVGDLRLYAAGGAVPTASTINFTADHVRANNAIIPLGAGGQITVQCDMPAGTTHFLFDVTGYFK